LFVFLVFCVFCVGVCFVFVFCWFCGGGGVGVFLLLYVPGSFSTYCMPNFCRMELSGMVWDLGWQ